MFTFRLIFAIKSTKLVFIRILTKNVIVKKMNGRPLFKITFGWENSWNSRKILGSSFIVVITEHKSLNL